MVIGPAGLEIEGPEYETIFALGGLNCLDSLEEVAYLNDLCDRLGLDTMSAGNISAFAVEASKRGRLDFPIDFNQPDRMAELFRDIAHARGACHLRGTFYKAELSGQMEKDAIPGKALHHVDYEDRAALFDCLILCRFFRDFILRDEIDKLIEGSTGIRMTKEELQTFANRVTEKTREFNRREGIGREQDTLPPLFLREATREGASLSAEDLALMIAEYNAVRTEKSARVLHETV